MKRILIACLLSFLPAFTVVAETLTGRVIGISDGDTLTILSDKKLQTKIRLAEIDAPESGQPYGQKSKQLLSKLVFGKRVTVDVQDRDRYGRTVGRVYQESRDINKELIRKGAAWVYRKYLRDPALLDDEKLAKQNEFGLWALPEYERVPPWEWRQGSRVPTQQDTKRSSEFSERSCSYKPYCKQIEECNDAEFYLKQCGLSRLDGDNDGIPCEALCKRR
jgi:endonuclease YncB( thermonuclease family)